ncbi:MAG: phage holin family protein [Tannerella sp.]|jgi:hypothetical protein|nr:phage holin family protein [Tannerella sp.]
MKDNMLFFKWAFSVIGALLGYLKPTVPFALICLAAVVLDCFSAWQLSKRVRKKYPDANDGKFKSKYASRVFSAIVKVYTLIVLAWFIDRIIIPTEAGWYLPNIVAGMFCFVQIWSFLENESSENGAKWARVLQRIMVNKAERHFDVPLNDILASGADSKTKQFN